MRFAGKLRTFRKRDLHHSKERQILVLLRWGLISPDSVFDQDSSFKILNIQIIGFLDLFNKKASTEVRTNCNLVQVELDCNQT